MAREWRCKYTPGPSGGPGDSESLKACQALLVEYLPKLKALPAAKITRQVCGGCMDFKVSITQPLAEHATWAEADYNPLEAVRPPLPTATQSAIRRLPRAPLHGGNWQEFVEKLKAIDGVSQVCMPSQLPLTSRVRKLTRLSYLDSPQVETQEITFEAL